MKANWEISITYNSKILKHEKSPPVCFVYGRWAFFFVYRNDYLNDIGLLYEGIYQAERNLCERLGEDENEDVETILNGMERITRILAMKMYEYGKYGCTARAGNQ